MTQVTQAEINKAAWGACDTFRGVVDPSVYKDYVLTLLFLKYVSDVWKDHHTRGKERREARLAWWNAEATTWPDATLSVPDPSELPLGELPDDAAAVIYRPDAPPVLVGHYKMTGAPRIEHPKAASLDYPDRPCIYLWSGEDHLSQNCLHTV